MIVIFLIEPKLTIFDRFFFHRRKKNGSIKKKFGHDQTFFDRTKKYDH
jgi:hypothetical protein